MCKDLTIYQRLALKANEKNIWISRVFNLAAGETSWDYVYFPAQWLMIKMYAFNESRWWPTFTFVCTARVIYNIGSLANIYTICAEHAQKIIV